MATLAEVEAHRTSIEDLIALLFRDLVGFWRTVDVRAPKEAAEQAREVVPALVAAYSLAAGTLAADWYDELRGAAGAVGNFLAEAIDGPSQEQVQRVLNYDLAPLFPSEREMAAGLVREAEEAAQAVSDDTLSRLAGSTQRLVSSADRGTIITNARNDPTAVRYARHASANACAFCALLATRQAVYRSEQSAARVVGRGTAKRNDGTAMDERRKGVRARGTQDLGEKFHDYCRCAAVPVWPGSELEEAPYVADWREAYFNATEKLGGAADTSKILASMRDDLGAK